MKALILIIKIKAQDLKLQTTISGFKAKTESQELQAYLQFIPTYIQKLHGFYDR